MYISHLSIITMINLAYISQNNSMVEYEQVSLLYIMVKMLEHIELHDIV
jgi:hypothetical protein